MSEEYSAAPIWEDSKAVGEPIDLLAMAVKVIRGWPLIALMGVGGGALGLLIALCLPSTFTSKALFLPPPQRFSATDNPVAALLKPPSSNIYSGMLLSDSVLADVVTHSDLQTLFHSRDSQDARRALQRLARVSTDSSGFVTLQVTYKDPRLAQQIASNFLAALSRLNDRLAISDAAQQRVFYKSELEREKNELESAEIALEQQQEKSGVVAPLSQTQAGLTAIDAARVEIREQEVRLAALEKRETDQAPEVVLAKSQLQALQNQLRALSSGNGPAGGGLSAAAAPKVNLEFVKLEREVKYHQALFDAISKQYENARMEETSAAPGVQVVDFPEVPARKSWPTKSLFVMVGGLLGLFLGLSTVMARHYWVKLQDDPERQASLNMLADAFRKSEFRPWKSS
jgi:tyrosine-protein kinase Etk/Wzc